LGAQNSLQTSFAELVYLGGDNLAFRQLKEGLKEALSPEKAPHSGKTGLKQLFIPSQFKLLIQNAIIVHSTNHSNLQIAKK